MPNIITHKLFAERVLQMMDKQDIKNIIEHHQQIFYIGSNGPDFLFFSNSKPWQAHRSHKLNHLGSAMHAKHINAFYDRAIQCIKEQQREDVRANMMAYLFGHLCHWALDHIAHPYIFYRTGNCRGMSAGLHHRFESMMDTMMLDKVYQLSIKDYQSYNICDYDDDMLKAIARIYIPVAKDVYHSEVSVHELRKTLDSWKDVQQLLYDPHHIKYPVLKGLEGMIRKPWMISGNVVKAKIDHRYDVLNEQKAIWKHPCDDAITSNASFMELFEQAILIAVSVIEKCYGCIAYDADVAVVNNILKDRAYDTGMSNEKEMKYFDIIYEKA